MQQHLEGKILNSIRQKLTLRPKRPIVFFITQSSNEKCRKWHFRDARFTLFEKDLLGSSTVEALLNTVWFNNTIHFGLLGCEEHREMCSRGDVKLCQNFHRAGVPRIQWKRNQNSFRKRSTECKSHCTENFCCAERPEMSSKGLQSLRRKATRGNENRRCTVLLWQ